MAARPAAPTKPSPIPAPAPAKPKARPAPMSFEEDPPSELDVVEGAWAYAFELVAIKTVKATVIRTAEIRIVGGSFICIIKFRT